MSKEDKKRIQLYKYSNPNIVFDKADNLFDDNIEIDISTHKNKKYMIRGDFTDNKWVHFGMMGYEDFTKHGDENRRHNFIKRNSSWAYRPNYTHAFLSFHLLW